MVAFDLYARLEEGKSMYRGAVRLLIVGSCACALACVIEFAMWVARVNAFVDETGGLIAIDISPDGPQRDSSLMILLSFGLIATWSRQAAYRALLVSGVLYFGLEALWWIFLPHVTFDDPEPLVHLLFGGALATAVTLYRRGAAAITIATVAPVTVCVRFGLWALESHQLRVACDVDTLQPPTALNNLWYGASWIHVLLFGFSVAAATTAAVGLAQRHSSEARSN